MTQTLCKSLTLIRPLPSVASGATFEGIPEKLRPHIEEIIRGEVPLTYLYGAVGTGKTCAAAIAYSSVQCRRGVCWFSVRTLLRQMIAARIDHNKMVEVLDTNGETRHLEAWPAWDWVSDASFVVLDDVATRTITEAQSDLLIEILEARTGKPTLITGNLNQSQLLEFLDPRLVSRLYSGLVIELTGKDRRTEGKAVKRV